MNKERRHCHHRPQRAETRADDAGPRSAPLGALHRERARNGLHRVWEHLGLPLVPSRPEGAPVAARGYLVAGLAGATLAAIGVFLPVYLVVVLVAPHFHRVAKNRQVKAFVDGVTAAATGAIAGAAVILGRRSLLDLPTILIALVTLALLLAPKKIPEPLLIVAAGLVGLVLKGAAPWP